MTRSDLPVGLGAAQATHAAFEFSRQHRLVTTGWQIESSFLVLVTVPDEQTLSEVAATATNRGLRVALFFEPDLNDQLTALAIEPGPEARRLCSAFPLLGRERVPAMSG